MSEVKLKYGINPDREIAALQSQLEAAKSELSVFKKMAATGVWIESDHYGKKCEQLKEAREIIDGLESHTKHTFNCETTTNWNDCTCGLKDFRDRAKRFLGGGVE